MAPEPGRVCVKCGALTVAVLGKPCPTCGAPFGLIPRPTNG